MDINQALRKRDAAVTSLRDLYSHAISCGLKSTQMNDSYAQIRERMGPAIPHWVASYVDGWRDALTADLYRNHLVFGTWIEGVFYSTHRDRADYYEKQGKSPRIYCDESEGNDSKGHYWAHNLKPFWTDADWHECERRKSA